MAHRSRIGILMASLLAVGVVATGCGVVGKVKQAVHNVEGNKATIDSFTPEPAIHQGHAVRGDLHDDGELAGHRRLRRRPIERRAGLPRDPDGTEASNVQVIVNPSGEYVCNQSGAGGAWSCQKLGQADAAAENKIFDLYTPSHWVSFLKGVSLVAGLAGDKVTSSTMSLNGFDMNCVDLVAKGVPGTSTICSTSQGILGYVKVASDSTSFQITNFSSTPASSLFQLPPGATVTTPTT